MKPGQTCDAAKKLITGSRHDEHGDYLKTFRMIADHWTIYKGVDFDPHDVAAMMALLKIVRLRENPGNQDNWTDGCGWLDLGAASYWHRS